MTDRASLADAIEYAIVGACNCVHIGNKSPEPDAHYETCRYRVLRLASDTLRAPPPDHAALVQALLATCDRLGMINRPADAPAAFARVLGEFGRSEVPGDACRAAAEDDDFVERLHIMAEGCDAASKDIGLPPGYRSIFKHAAVHFREASRHLPSDRYGEGFAAGVEAAAEKLGALAKSISIHPASLRTAHDEERRCAYVFAAAEVRALTPHGDDHG